MQAEMQAALNNVLRALGEFYARETFLFAKDLGERTLTHRLAVHLEKQFPGWEVDCDYNRLGERTLRLPHGTIVSTDDQLGKSVYPDIVVHQRTISSPSRFARQPIISRRNTTGTSCAR